MSYDDTPNGGTCDQCHKQAFDLHRCPFCPSNAVCASCSIKCTPCGERVCLDHAATNTVCQVCALEEQAKAGGSPFLPSTSPAAHAERRAQARFLLIHYSLPKQVTT